VNILVLSDLHIGATARCKSMTPSNAHTTKTIDEDLLKKLIARLKADFPIIDFVVLSGDMADRAEHEQYEHFDAVIGQLEKDLRIPSGRIVFSPGNHDVDWSTLNAVETIHKSGRRWASRYSPIKESTIIKSSLAAGDGDPFDGDYATCWSFPDIEFITLNTAAKDGPKDENHPGEISREMLAAVSLMVATSTKAPGTPRILLIHHHPIQYENVFVGWKDFSILQCPVDLINFCAEQKVDLIIHGHRHQPNFRQMVSSDGHIVSVLASGSVSAQFPSYVYDNLSNQAHVVTLNGRDDETLAIKGVLNNLAFSQVNGWRASRRETDGIDGRIAFGSLMTANSLYLLVRKFVVERLNTVGHVRMADVIARHDRMNLQPPQVLEAVIKKIKAELKVEQFGMDAANAILVKESSGD